MGAYMSDWRLGLCTCFLLAATVSQSLAAPRSGQLLVGWASTSITPDKPIALSGQFHTRISKFVHDPVTATALAIEVKDDAGVVDQAVMVSCDVVAIRPGIQEGLRDRLAGKLSDFDLQKLMLNATHTHTGPVLSSAAKYDIPKHGVMQVAEYVDFLLERLANIVIEAWRSRKPGGVSWALSYATVGHNRRLVYEDGTAKMYGRPDTPTFRNVEGSDDHGIELLFFWDQAGQPTGIAIDIACPSQVVEGERYVSADFWHDVRNELRSRYGKQLYILALCSAAGDQSPHCLLRKRAEASLRKRKKISETEEIAQRIAGAVDHVFDAGKGDVRTTVPFVHTIEQLSLPARRISEQEAQRAQARVDAYVKKGIEKLSETERTKLNRERNVVAQYGQQSRPPCVMELHVLRLGDVAIATNPFELFLDFGLRMKARSRAEQTFLVQLACGWAGYLPTEKAVRAGGYGAEPPSNQVGPEGGRMLVERTVELINAMWPAKK